MNQYASSVDIRATKASTLGLLGERPQRTIRIRALNHYYGQGDLRKQVLFDNNLDVYEGQIVIMTGPSGSGKTTLLTLMGTLRTVQEGSAQVLGQELAGASQAQVVAARRNIGFIFQAHNLFGSLTAMQNVRMAMELFPFSEAEIRERATQLLQRLGLGERVDYQPQRLSGGQKQRVAIARGLAHKPKIVLADEPTAALDEHSGREVVTLLKELATEERMSIILVTHDNRILDVADRIVNMVDGRIKSDVVVREADLIVEFIQNMVPFRGLTLSTLASIADKMWAEQHDAGEVVIRQGDAGKNFYIIRQGEVEVVREEDGKDRLVARLGEGNCFGEEALLTGKPRNATVRTADETLLYVLGEEDFQEAVEASESLRDELAKVLFERQ
ncbi:MAG TPA: ATP-binding cassette domain-containing protein [Pirellulales bacterium]